MQSLKMNSFEEIKGIAVAIKNIKDSQNHIGIIYRNFEKNKIELLHLAFHRDLRNETPHHYHWIVPKLHSNPLLHEIKIKAIARQCRIVWERHGSYYNLKYGLTYGLRFTTEGDIVGKSSGFTCATFVMAIFESCGYKMLDYTLWERTDEDEKWKISIINVLKEFGVSEEEISVIEQERTKSFRYRPEQVGATCFFDQSQWPLPFSQANPKGQELSLAIKKNFDD